MQAEGRRKIDKSSRYDKYFSTELGEYTITHKSGADVFDSVALIQQVVKECSSQTAAIAKVLQGRDRKSTCRNIWNFVYQNIQYKLDEVGDEVREPSRIWADRIEGVDCDCYSVFISSILTNLGIPHLLRMTSYKGRENWQHIYPVAFDETGREIIIDCVTDRYNYEVAYTNKKDFMQLARLSGIPAGGDSLSKEGFIIALERNIKGAASKMAMLLFAPNGERAYQAILQSFTKLGGTKAELDRAINIGRYKPETNTLSGLGIAGDLIAGAIMGSAGMISDLTEAFTGNKLAAAREQTAQAQTLADAQIIKAQLDAQAKAAQIQADKDKLAAEQEQTKMYLIAGGAAAALITVGVIATSGSKTAAPRGRGKSLRGTPKKAPQKKQFKGQQTQTQNF